LGQDRGYDFKVFADETRPLLQGARLTSWELHKAGVDVTLICDNMANLVMKNGWVDAVLVGCDRMAMNGDGANKIGTSALAVLAKEHGIPFYMFVPTSTLDPSKASGDDIPIELREGDEIRSMWYDSPMAPEGVAIYNPSFDITPGEYITAVITEKGIVRPPYDINLKALFD
jgi:methylthioribose-1-phosphate isomerase